MLTVTLYSAAGCHLCEDARALFQQLVVVQNLSDRLQLQEVDIFSQPEKLQLWGERIPVLESEAGEALCYPFDDATLLAFVERALLKPPIYD